MQKVAAAPSLFQFGRHKLIHLVRHAQGMHNLEVEKNRDPLTSIEFLDAQLSSLGWQQVHDQRKNVCSSGLLERVEVVITSPMSRTLQTAVGIFHGEYEADDGLGVTSFEVAKVKSEDETSATLNRPPIIAYELCRERLGKFECDKRGSISQYRSRFPKVDFSLIETEDDILWKGGDEKENHEAVRARAVKFFQWLLERKEEEIAVVSHGVFLEQAMIELIQNNMCYPLMDGDPRSRFRNCEMRSVFISYESIMGLGSDASSPMKNQYCGRIDSAKDHVSVEELELTN